MEILKYIFIFRLILKESFLFWKGGIKKKDDLSSLPPNPLLPRQRLKLKSPQSNFRNLRRHASHCFRWVTKSVLEASNLVNCAITEKLTLLQEFGVGLSYTKRKGNMTVR